MFSHLLFIASQLQFMIFVGSLWWRSLCLLKNVIILNLFHTTTVAVYSENVSPTTVAVQGSLTTSTGNLNMFQSHPEQPA